MESLQHFFISFWNAITPLELTGFVFALLYSILASYEKVWCWPAAIISSGIFVFICFNDKANLQAILQLFYVGMAIYGWYEWMYGKREAQQLNIVSFPRNKILMLVAVGVPFTVVGALIDEHYNASMPWLDSVITVYSLIATWMMAKKIVQNWLFWVVIDPLSIWLFAARGRLLIGLLFLIYTAIAIFGYFKWRKMMQHQAVSA